MQDSPNSPDSSNSPDPLDACNSPDSPDWMPSLVLFAVLITVLVTVKRSFTFLLP